MNRFIKNIAALTLVFVAVLGIISCETDFENIESGVLKNDLTTTGEVPLDIKITPIKDLGGIRADNIELGFSGDMWLGNFTQNEFSKSIKAGFVSQLNFPSTSLVTASLADPENIQFFLDKVVLKIPYNATPTGGIGTNGETLFRLDSILKTNSNEEATKIKVYRNPFFLNTLNPEKPNKQNSFQSNFDYFLVNSKQLLSKENFSFIPSTDSIYSFFNRIDRTTDLNSTTTFRDSIVLNPRQPDGVLPEATSPFLAIPLDLEKMKTLFWDKFTDDEFSSNSSFQDYFRGLIVVPEDNNGVLVPFNLNNANAQLSFIFSIIDATSSEFGSTYREYNFTLGGVTNATYEMSPAEQETSSDNFIVQGTDGSNAEVEILGVNISTLPQDHFFLKYADKDINKDGYLGLDDLNELNDENGNPLIIINDASLQFYVDQSINTDTKITPQQLHLFKDSDSEKNKIPTNISDAYEAPLSFGGNLSLKEDGQTPDNYTFKITDFISDFVDGSNTNNETKLILKVFNEVTDEPIVNNSSIRFNVEDYNWNPRSVVLYNETAASSKKAQLTIKYTELNK